MKKFIILYRAPKDAQMQTASMTAEEQAKGMEAWMTWATGCGKSLVDLGAPLTNGKTINSAGRSDGDNTMAGYSVIQAVSMDEAMALLANHPHIMWNAACAIEVFETMPLPGM